MTDRKNDRNNPPESDNDSAPDAPKTQRRRRLLNILGISGSAAFVPAFWSKPVVKSLILPAHAQTSPPEPSPVSFSDPCSVTLQFTPGQVGLYGCTGGQFTNVIPTVTGTVVGEGDLSGITINIETILTGGSVGPQPINGTTTTDGGGNYSLTLDGLPPPSGVGGPHIICTQDCDGNFPSGGGVQATASSPDPRLAGQAVCSTTFTCEDIDTSNGSVAERSDGSSEFYVQLQPVEPSSRNS